MMPGLDLNLAASSSSSAANTGGFVFNSGAGKMAWLPLAIIGAVLLLGLVLWKGGR
jgi:hypothetical protein